MAIEKKHVTLKFKINEDGSMKVLLQSDIELPPGEYTAIIEIDDSADVPEEPS